MRTITYTKNDTSEMNVKSFLDRIEDGNPIHWNKRVMPGMYALYLLQKTMKRPISRVNAKFNDLVIFPEVLEAKLIDEPYKTHFRFSRRGNTVYEGDLHHLQNRELSTNKNLLWKVYLIGGKLQREYRGSEFFPEGQTGVYSYQSMNFEEGVRELEEPYFTDTEQIDEKTYNILTLCDTEDGKLGAEGHALIKVIPERLMDLAIRREERKKERAT